MELTVEDLGFGFFDGGGAPFQVDEVIKKAVKQPGLL